MILKELYNLAHRERLVPEPGFQPVKVSYIVVVGLGGRLDSIVSTLEPPVSGKGKPIPRSFRLPKDNGRTVQIEPQFLWDKSVYVFGIDPEKDEKARRNESWLRERQASFLKLVRKAADETGDPALKDLVSLLATLLARPLSRVEFFRHLGCDVLEPNANFTFRHAEDPEGLIIERPQVREFWRRQNAGPADSARARCLVTGEADVPIDIHPTIKLVPGGNTKGVSLVSFNRSAFESYGLRGNDNAVIGRAAAEAIAAALNRLLDRRYPNPESNLPMPFRRFDIAAETALLFWSKGGDEALDIFSRTALDADPQKVRALYASPQDGRRPVLDDPSQFYALALSGEMARAKIRGWYELTLGEALRNIRQHFDDIAIHDTRSPAPLPLWRLLLALAPLGDKKKLAPDMAARAFEAVITGRPYPRALLEGAVRRARVEKDKVTLERAACLKAYFVRARRAGRLGPDFPEVKPNMDQDQKNVPYRLGRLFATLEKLQEEAVNANATIRDRYFGAASAAPVTVFPRLLRGAQPHISKANRGVFFERLIQEIVAPVAGFPSHLNLEEQGLFALGYYHQRQSFFQKKADSIAHEEV